MRVFIASLLFMLFGSQVLFSQQALDDSIPDLGLKLIDTKEAVARWKQEKLPIRATPKHGLFIENVIVGSDAYEGGIRALDLVEKINNTAVRTIDRIDKLIENKKPGDIVEVKIRRLAENGIWVPIRGSIRIGTKRTNYYSQLKVSIISTAGSRQASHKWFSGRKDYVAPVIVCSEKGTSIRLEISSDASDAMNPNRVTIRSGSKTLDMPVELLSGSQDRYLVDGDARVHDVALCSLNGEMEKLLRMPGKKSVLIEGPARHSEYELSNIDDSAIQAMFSVYDDLLATKNTDFTLRGRVAHP